LDEAMEYKEQKGREEGLKEGTRLGEMKEREKTVRALQDVLAPEVIAEKLQLSLEYVLAVLSGASVVSEPEVPYNAKKKE
ncbi:MAG: hypothetical protein IJN31_00605, partial [Peptococcaceae bacterium]|nr:hypothetical protein [Peptococcaceae bacterium]